MREVATWIIDEIKDRKLETNEQVKREYQALENMRRRVRAFFGERDLSEIREIQHQYKVEADKWELIDWIMENAGKEKLAKIDNDYGLDEPKDA